MVVHRIMLKLREFLLINVNKTIHHNIVQQFLCSQSNFYLSPWYLKQLPRLNVPPHLGFSQSWTNSDLPLSEDQVLHYSCSSDWKKLLRSPQVIQITHTQKEISAPRKYHLRAHSHDSWDEFFPATRVVPRWTVSPAPQEELQNYF